MTCPQCGAAIRKGDGRFCSHCAAALPDRPRIAPEEWSTHAERFAEAEQNAQHATAVGLPAPAPAMVTTVVLPAVFLVFWIGIGSMVTAGFARGPGGGMMFFPLLLMIGGVVAIGWHIATALRKAKAPVLRRLAVVVDERTEISTSGTSDNRSTTTTYYATLQFEDGARLELPTTGGVAGHATRGDIGLAVMRGGDLVDFHRYRL